MTDEKIMVLAITVSILVLTVLSRAIVQATRRRQGMIRRAPAPAAATHLMATNPAAAQPAPHRSTVVLGPPRPIRLAPGQMPAAPTPTVIRRGLPLVVPRRENSLWQEKGWHRNGRGYEGLYRAGRHEWRGLIQEPYPGAFNAFIWDPPLAELHRRTNHRPCFNSAGVDGRFKVHFHTMPSSLDHGIASIEAVLAQAMGVR